MTETAVNTSTFDIADLKGMYMFKNKTEVLHFLDRHPILVPVLLEAPDKIRNYFPDSQLFLEVVPDAEIVDWVQLILSISINIEPDEAAKRENQMDKDWWLGVPRDVRQHICILLEYADDF